MIAFKMLKVRNKLAVIAKMIKKNNKKKKKKKKKKHHTDIYGIG